MKRAVGLVMAAGFFVSAAQGADLNLSVESGGSNDIAVAAGQTVDYVVMGQLSTNDNAGLALVGFDLELIDEATSQQAAPLSKADVPTSVEMLNFAVPLGINNPDESVPGDGFGGTVSNGKLLQCCGAQNTIHNTVDCSVDDDCPGASNLCDAGTCTASAPFPVGTVIENLAIGSQLELLRGSLTIPGDAVEGDVFVLTLTTPFANVISTVQNNPDFQATEPAGQGTIANLRMTVCAEVTAEVWSSVGSHDSVGDVGLAITDGAYVEPRLSGVNRIEVDFSGAVDAATAIPANVIVEGCTPDGSAIDLSGVTTTTSLMNGRSTLVIEFSPKLPGSAPLDAPAKYQITLAGMTNDCGAPITAGSSRVLWAILGDIVSPPNGSQHVNSSDVGIARSFASQGIDPIDPGNILHVRADLTGDGKINSSDVGLARSMAGRGKDGRTIPCFP